jgi:mannan endo-1,4-beta-mannosidase
MQTMHTVQSRSRPFRIVGLTFALALVIGLVGTTTSGAVTDPTPTAAPRPARAVVAAATTKLKARNAPSRFVRRRGTSLTLDGRVFRFTGINIYMAASGGTPKSCGGELYPNVGVPLAHLPRGTVFRFWAFQNFFVSHGTFNWTNLDRVLAIAAAHGDKVIPVLANQYDYCDNAKDLGWYQSGYKTTTEPGDLLTYRNYVAKVMHRYKSNPTVAMWQLVNEGEAVNADGSCTETAATKALLAFSNDVGGVAHRIDRNHLVSLGTLAGYSGSGEQWCGARNADYQRLMASPGTDVCDFHDYAWPTRPMGLPSGPNLASAIRQCRRDAKPIMVAETGVYAASHAALAARAKEFRAKFSAQFAAGVVGELMWTWEVTPAFVFPPQDPDYGIFPGDPSLSVLGTVCSGGRVAHNSANCGSARSARSAQR